MKPASAHDCWQMVSRWKFPRSPLHVLAKGKLPDSHAPLHVRPSAPYRPVPGVNGGGIASVQESEHGDDGGDHCEITLEARSTANHCGGTALLSDWRAWAVELGLGEINGLMVLVPGTRPCQLERCG